MNRGAAALLVAAYVFSRLTLAFGLLWRTEELLGVVAGGACVSRPATGSLALLMIGHLFSEAWLRPIRLPLEAAASTLPLVAALLILSQRAQIWSSRGLRVQFPEFRISGRLYFDQPFVLFRGVVIVITWIESP